VPDDVERLPSPVHPSNSVASPGHPHELGPSCSMAGTAGMRSGRMLGAQLLARIYEVVPPPLSCLLRFASVHHPSLHLGARMLRYSYPRCNTPDEAPSTVALRSHWRLAW